MTDLSPLSLRQSKPLPGRWMTASQNRALVLNTSSAIDIVHTINPFEVGLN